MDIRYKLKTRIENASLQQKIGFYQCRYCSNLFGQLVWLIQIYSSQYVAGRIRKENHAKLPANCFVNYKAKKVLSPGLLLKELYKYDVISFDIFDTLLCRAVRNPADVFYAIEKKSGIPGFEKCRIEAEKAARQLKYEQCMTFEIAIEDIYQVLKYNRNQVSEEQEFEMEMSFCAANPLLLRLVEKLLAEGKRVIAVSDMYLHEEQILKLLCHCGYTNLKEIYVSCDHMASKSDGKLFPIVMQKMSIKEKIIHIGDNFYSDVYRQKALDMETIHYLT